jgi:hypothetical protein
MKVLIMKRCGLILILFLIINSISCFASEVNYLEKCWQKQVVSLNGAYLKLGYSAISNNLYSSMEAWQ